MSTTAQAQAAKLRKSKCDMFSERETTEEALQYALSMFPDAKPQVTTALMVYHNTLLENAAKAIEEGAL